MNRSSLMRRAGVSVLVAIALLTAFTAGAAARPTRSQAQMNVFAAASLVVAFPKFDGGQKYNFAGTDALAAQIRLGAPADVFAGASPDAPQALYRAGLVDQPVTFATNKLVLAVPIANPANINSIYDVERPGTKLLIGTPTVPIGAYTRQVLNNMGITNQVLPRVVSQEQNVTAIQSKVALGTADAGFMYVTDALAVADKVKVIPVPAWAQPPVRYQIAIVSKSPNKADAAAFIKRLTSTAGPQAAGRQRLRRAEAAAGQEEGQEEGREPRRRSASAAARVARSRRRGKRQPASADASRGFQVQASVPLPGGGSALGGQLDELDRIALGDAPGLDHPAVERDLPAELLDDPPQHLRILVERVGVECRHHAARAAVADADQHVAGTQTQPGPIDLGKAFGALDHDVRPEAPAIDADGLDDPGRDDRERQDVEALAVIGPAEANDLGARPGHRAHPLARGRGRPRQPVDQRLAVVVQRCLQAEQPGPEARRHDTPRLLPHVREAIAGDAVLGDVRNGQPLAAQRLHRVAPELRHAHRSRQQDTPGARHGRRGSARSSSVADS